MEDFHETLMVGNMKVSEGKSHDETWKKGSETKRRAWLLLLSSSTRNAPHLPMMIISDKS
jgi:hypothetical protein